MLLYKLEKHRRGGGKNSCSRLLIHVATTWNLSALGQTPAFPREVTVPVRGPCRLATVPTSSGSESLHRDSWEMEMHAVGWREVSSVLPLCPAPCTLRWLQASPRGAGVSDHSEQVLALQRRVWGCHGGVAARQGPRLSEEIYFLPVSVQRGLRPLHAFSRH